MRASEPEANSAAPKVSLSDRKTDRNVAMPAEESAGLETTGRAASTDPQPVDQSQPGTKRRTQSAPQQRTRMSIKQRWVGKQQHLAEQVQQLKEQAEYINQQLAAKHKRRSRSESSPSRVQLGLDGDTANLEGQLERVMRLLTELEMALAEGGAIAAEFSQPIATPSTLDRGSLDSAVSPPQPTSFPQTDTDEEIAAALRQMKAAQPSPTARRSKSRVQSAPSPKPPSTAKSHRRQSQLDQVLKIPHRPIDKIVDATLWIVFPALLRFGFNGLLAVFPGLSPIAIGLLLAPAALAIYLTFFVPKTGLVPIYRLFLVMLGLLLGGRF
jgi:hypothetical protein